MKRRPPGFRMALAESCLTSYQMPYPDLIRALPRPRQTGILALLREVLTIFKLQARPWARLR